MLFCALILRGGTAGAEPSEALALFEERLPLLEEQIPLISRAAERAAFRTTAYSNTLLNVPYSDQPCFAEEIINRAGGLANALPWTERLNMTTPNDIVLVSVRSWDKDGARVVERLSDYHRRGWLTLLFASRVGMPPEATADYVFDNGAQSWSADEGPFNALANTCNAWLWCCEYTAALTRRGVAPGILRSIFLPDGQAHNGPRQTPEGRRTLEPCTNSVEAGVMAGQYLQRVHQLCESFKSPYTEAQIHAAAGVVADQLATGGQVVLSTCTHFLLYESFFDYETPWRPIEVVWESEHRLPQNVSRSDVFVWFGYLGMSTPYEDFGRFIRQTDARIITSYVPDLTNLANNANSYAEAHIDQAWRPGDAEVPIPFFPGKMGPVSGLNVGLLYRMLDEAVVEELDTLHAAQPGGRAE